jgi:hypothetical protein
MNDTTLKAPITKDDSKSEKQSANQACKHLGRFLNELQVYFNLNLAEGDIRYGVREDIAHVLLKRGIDHHAIAPLLDAAYAVHLAELEAKVTAAKAQSEVLKAFAKDYNPAH